MKLKLILNALFAYTFAFKVTLYPAEIAIVSEFLYSNSSTTLDLYESAGANQIKQLTLDAYHPIYNVSEGLYCSLGTLL